MNTTTLMTATGLIVIAGQWSKEDKLNLKIAIGAVVAAIGLTIIGQASPDIAEGIAMIALVAATLRYGPHLFKSISSAVGAK